MNEKRLTPFTDDGIVVRLKERSHLSQELKRIELPEVAAIAASQQATAEFRSKRRGTALAFGRARRKAMEGR